MQRNDKIRNIAIIAHVDHGKTTLVDQLFRQGGVYKANEVVGERVMDNTDLERERGITILAKNCAVAYKGVKINIVDTPGHADFGGEVERALTMVDGVILLVDSAEGPLPQTRFVLRKALTARLPIVVVVNKIDRKDARPAEVLDQVYNLFIDLDASEDQLDFPVLYAVGRDGIASAKLEEKGTSLDPLFELIVSHIPGPQYDPSKPLQMLVTNLGYSDYLGRLAIGRVFNGYARIKDDCVCIGEKGPQPLKIAKLQVYQGVTQAEVEEIQPGDIAILAGVENVSIGDTICTKASPLPLPRLSVDEPTISMRFMGNTSPFAGRDGKYCLPQKLGERLRKECLTNVALKLEASQGDESFNLKGRGEFQMVILIETLRREGFELCVGRPQIIYKKGPNGEKLEPIEHLYIDVPDEYLGVINEKLALRKGQMTNMVNHGSGRIRLEFSIPSRGLIGYRNEFLTDTKGTGIMNSLLHGYEAYRGDIVSRINGSLVCDRTGEAVPYALFHLEPRGIIMIQPQDEVYEGMIIGEHNRPNDLDVNPCKAKKLTNVRSAGRDENIVLTPVTPMSLEKAIEFIRDDEWVEVTPKTVRLRKAYLTLAAREAAKRSGKTG